MVCRSVGVHLGMVLILLLGLLHGEANPLRQLLCHLILLPQQPGSSPTVPTMVVFDMVADLRLLHCDRGDILNTPTSKASSQEAVQYSAFVV